MNTIGIIR